MSNSKNFNKKKKSIDKVITWGVQRMENKSFAETIGKYKPSGKITLQKIIQDLGDNAFPFTILLLTLPCIIPLPMPPGYTTIFGVVIFIISWQWFKGNTTPKLPSWIARKEVDAKIVNTLIDKAEPILEFIEKFIKPRHQSFFDYKYAQKWLAFYFIFNSIVLAIPVPIGNIFAGAAILIGALTALEKDGIGILLSGILSAIATAITIVVTIIGWILIEKTLAIVL